MHPILIFLQYSYSFCPCFCPSNCHCLKSILIGRLVYPGFTYFTWSVSGVFGMQKRCASYSLLVDSTEMPSGTGRRALSIVNRWLADSEAVVLVGVDPYLCLRPACQDPARPCFNRQPMKCSKNAQTRSPAIILASQPLNFRCALIVCNFYVIYSCSL